MPALSKKIICTVTNDLTYDQRMIRICTSLTSFGFEVLLVGRVLPGSRPLEQQVFQQKRLRCFFQSGKLFYLEYNLRLLLLLLRQQTDLICAIDLDTLVPGFIACRLKRTTCIYDAHEYFTEVPEVVDRPFTKWIWSQVGKTIIPRLQKAYTVGPQLARLLQEEYKTPFETIRNLPNQQSKKVQPPTNEQVKIILYQGRLNEGRGLEASILAMHQIEGAQLWLAGEGDLSAALRQLVAQEQLQEKVHFLGYLQPEALRSVTLQAHIGLNLLENKGLSYYYSLANKAFDYIQVGLPSIQMNFPEYQSLQEKYGVFVLIDQLEVSSVVQVLQELLQDQKQWMQLHQQCLSARSELCWEKEAQILQAFYQSLM